MDLWFWFVSNLPDQIAEFYRVSVQLDGLAIHRYTLQNEHRVVFAVQPKTVLINNKTIGDNFSYQSQSSPRSVKVLITGTYHNRCQSRVLTSNWLRLQSNFSINFKKLQSNKENNKKTEKVYTAKTKSKIKAQEQECFEQIQNTKHTGEVCTQGGDTTKNNREKDKTWKGMQH